MTLDELAETLPNGFHDAEVQSLTLDYMRREARFQIRVWAGDLSSPPGDEREAYRTALLVLSDLAYCAVESPDPRYPYLRPDGLTIDTGAVATLASPPAMRLPGRTPEGTFTNWFFVQQ